MTKKLPRDRARRSPKARAPWLSPRATRWLAYAPLVAVLVFVTLVRMKLLDIPLERDEGGFAYVAKEFWNGRPLYTELRDTKLPGLYVFYGLLMKLFGDSPAGIHMGLLFVNLATIVIFYLLVNRLYGRLAAAIAAATYGILAIGPGVYGFATHATQLLVLPGILGLCLLLKGIEGRRRFLFLAGLLFGLAFTVKQPAVHFMLLSGVFVAVLRLRDGLRGSWKPLLADETVLILGSVAPYIVVALTMVVRGVFSEFWFWTVEWPADFASMVSAESRWNLFRYQIDILTRDQVLLWILAGAGFVWILVRPREFSRKVFPILYTIFMFGAVCTGFHFYPHYFVNMLAPVALLCGVLVADLGAWLRGRFQRRWVIVLPVVLFLIFWGQILRDRPDYFFHPNLEQIVRQTYPGNPFVESIEIGRFIHERRNAGDTMVVFGSEPQMYLYADCEAASGHVFTYPLVDGGPYNTQLQDEMMQEVTAAAPRFVIYVTAPSSWLKYDARFVKRIEDYVNQYYVRVGVVDVLADRAIYAWDEESRTYRPQSPSVVFISERMPE